MIKKYGILLFVFITLILCSSCQKASLKTKIQFSLWGAKTQMDVMYELISDFEKENPNIEVEIIHIPQNYFQKLHLLIASNLTPDVVMINNINGRLYIENNRFEILNDYFDNDISKDVFFEASQ